MDGYVELRPKRNRGWPWPERSWGLTPMFGERGWCRACGVPRHPQSGSLVLARSGMATAAGAWVPNWQFDVICLDRHLGLQVADRFPVELLDVAWRGFPPGEALQIVVPTIGDSWFEPDALRAAALARHGVDGAACSACEVWRWMPLGLEDLPPPQVPAAPVEVPVAASPEWFGDGWLAFRQILVARDLAGLIAAASPDDFVVAEVP
jgi:hypothetical protein